jgi:hypothetical protein
LQESRIRIKPRQPPDALDGEEHRIPIIRPALPPALQIALRRPISGELRLSKMRVQRDVWSVPRCLRNGRRIRILWAASLVIGS